MDISVYSIKAISDEDVAKLIDERRSFVLEDIPLLSMPEAVEALERLIEGKGLSCRVYTKGRVAAVGAFAVPTPLTAAVSLGSAAFIGAHNLATFNPDYEIAKNLATGTISLQAQEKWSIGATLDSVTGLFKSEK